MSVIIYNTKYYHKIHPHTQLDLFGKLGNTPTHHKKNVFFGNDTPNRQTGLLGSHGSMGSNLDPRGSSQPADPMIPAAGIPGSLGSGHPDMMGSGDPRDPMGSHWDPMMGSIGIRDPAPGPGSPDPRMRDARVRHLVHARPQCSHSLL